MGKLKATDILRLPTAPFRLFRTTLPRDWLSLMPGISHAYDIKIRREHLALKVLVFDDAAGMRRFWAKKLACRGIGKHCVGVVTRMQYHTERSVRGVPRPAVTMVDRRFYAVMGLVRSQISEEIVVHEGVHAAIAYLARTHRMGRRWSGPGDIDEEELAYPMGSLCAELLRALRSDGLL